MNRDQPRSHLNLSWILLGGIFLTFAIAPLLVQLGAPEILVSMLFFIVQGVILRMFSQTRARFILSLVIFIPAVLANAYFIYADSREASLFFLVTAATFLGYATFALLKDIFSTKEVDTQTLLNAVSAYLLIAMTSAMIHGLISFFIPGSYNFVDIANTRSDIFDLVYFSVVTLTTLGYGDYLPLSEIARSFVAIEALIGQIFIAVIIARLVGLHSAKSV